MNDNANQPKEQKINYALKPDAQAFDEVRMKVVPRFKESELSGSEWRISVEIEFYRNGQVVHKELGGHNMESTCGMLYYEYLKAVDNGKGWFAGDGIHCDQEGCHEKGTYLYRIKKDYCVGGGNCGQEKKKYSEEHRLFCQRHATRDDQDLKDNDENYELISVI